MNSRTILALGIVILAGLPLVFISKFRLVDTQQNAAPNKDADPAEQYLRDKINNIVIPIVDFDDTTVEEALDFLRLRARELDPAEEESRKGLGFIIRKPSVIDPKNGTLYTGADAQTGPNLMSLTVNTKGRNMTMSQVLDLMCIEAKLQWKIAEGKVILEPIDSESLHSCLHFSAHRFKDTSA